MTNTTWRRGAIAAVLCISGSITAGATSTPGPLMRASLARLDAAEANSLARRSEKPRPDWTPVTRLRPGSDIIITVRGLYALNQRLLSADGDGVTVLDAVTPVLPKDVRQSLLAVAAERPFTLLAARTEEVQMPRSVRATPAGVFHGDRRVSELTAVLRSIPRSQIVDLQVRRKHVGSHARRGLLIGAAIGVGVGAAFSASNGFDETLPVMGFGAVFGAAYGVGVGAVVGVLAPASPDVIYHVD